MVKSSSSPPKPKAVIIVGPDSTGQHNIKALHKAFAKKGFKKGDDYLIIGNGKHSVKAYDLHHGISDRIDQTTRFFIWGHGLVEEIDGTKTHTIDILETNKKNASLSKKQLATGYLLKYLQNAAQQQPLYIEIFSCFGGKSKEDIDCLHPGSTLITHADDKFISYIPTNIQVIIRNAVRHMQHVGNANFDPVESSLLSYGQSIAATIESTSISYRSPHGKTIHHTCRLPDKVLNKRARFEEYKSKKDIPEYANFVSEHFEPYATDVNAFTTTLPLQKLYKKIEFTNDLFQRTRFGATHNIPAYTEHYASISTVERKLIYPFERMQILMEAAEAGSTDVLDQYFTLNPNSTLINTPFHSSTPHFKQHNGKTLLHIAAHSPESTLVLMKHGADIHQASLLSGSTALHYASIYPKTTLLLLGQGANPNVRDHEGLTPLLLAASHRSLDVADILLNYAASPKVIDPKTRETPLHFFVLTRQAHHVASLLDANVPACTPNKYGITPLHLAAQNGDEEVIALLLPHYKEVDIKAKTGNTPLHLALNVGSFNVAALLLENGADPHLPDSSGELPLALAIKSGSNELTELLLQHGASPHLKSEGIKESAYDLAVRLRFQDSLTLFEQYEEQISARKTSNETYPDKIKLRINDDRKFSFAEKEVAKILKKQETFSPSPFG